MGSSGRRGGCLCLRRTAVYVTQNTCRVGHTYTIHGVKHWSGKLVQHLCRALQHVVESILNSTRCQGHVATAKKSTGALLTAKYTCHSWNACGIVRARRRRRRQSLNAHVDSVCVSTAHLQLYLEACCTGRASSLVNFLYT